jgi:ribonuclease P protein component
VAASAFRLDAEAPEVKLLARPALAMTRPGDGDISFASEAQAARPCVARLKKRADFVAAAKGRREHQRCFVLQARPRPETANAAALQDNAICAPRFGFTVTKKIGNSVIRNRIRRRLREVVRLTDFSLPKSGHDYVLIGRIEALTAPFEDMRAEISRALTKIHQSRIRQTKTHQTGPDGRPPAVPAVDRKQDH